MRSGSLVRRPLARGTPRSQTLPAASPGSARSADRHPECPLPLLWHYPTALLRSFRRRKSINKEGGRCIGHTAHLFRLPVTAHCIGTDPIRSELSTISFQLFEFG